MNVLRPTLVLTVLALVAACAPAPATPGPAQPGPAVSTGSEWRFVSPFGVFGAQAMTLALPPGVVAQLRPATPDFAVYDFQHDGKTILSVDLGAAPSFDAPSFNSESARQETINGAAAVSLVAATGDGASRDTLVRLPAPTQWPQTAHFFYRGDSSADAALADRMIASFQAGAARPDLDTVPSSRGG